ncbi:MAG: GTP-binding protein [Asgard group archaeon]|nr:GTP-binding protein [Asgard group archaeon]
MEPVIKFPAKSKNKKLPSFKIVLVGNSKTGKTTLLEALTITGSSEKGYSASITIPISTSEKDLKNCPKIEGKIFDLRSQRYFPYLHALFYNNAKGAIIVFDLTDKKSFEALSYWKQIVWGNAGMVPLLFCGNKSDLVQKNPKNLTRKKILEYINQESAKFETAIDYIEMSAKNQEIIYFSLKHEQQFNINELANHYDPFIIPFVRWLMTIYKTNAINNSL